VGVKGDTGATGPTGADGAAGPKGDKGDTGVAGPTGATGSTGLQGLKGDTGASGPVGAQGLKGDTGATGPQGLKGDTGVAGPAGPAGPQGLPGATGLQGPKGDTGAIGPIGPQGPAGNTPTLSCPAGWIDLGPTCIEPSFTASGTIEEALNRCYSLGGRVCEHQDLAYACANRANLGLNFPDDTWLHTGSVTLRSVGSSSSFVAYAVYRRVASRCFGPSTVNPTDGIVNFDLYGAVRNYACCAARSF
jgi:hypothetical protein